MLSIESDYWPSSLSTSVYMFSRPSSCFLMAWASLRSMVVLSSSSEVRSVCRAITLSRSRPVVVLAMSCSWPGSATPLGLGSFSLQTSSSVFVSSCLPGSVFILSACLQVSPVFTQRPVRPSTGQVAALGGEAAWPPALCQGPSLVTWHGPLLKWKQWCDDQSILNGVIVRESQDGCATFNNYSYRSHNAHRHSFRHSVHSFKHVKY